MKPSRMILTLLASAVAIALAACASTPPAQSGSAQPAAPTPDPALQADAAEYARQSGVSQEEALRRLSLQEEAGELQAALQQDAADTFAGLWLQHEPDFRLVVAFTENGEGTIRPYLEGKPWADLVELRVLPYSLAELEAAQAQVMQAAQSLSIPISSGISVTENRVTVEVGSPDLFRDELRQAGQELPEPVEVRAIDPGNLPDTLRSEVGTYAGPGGQTIYFPKQAPTNAFMAALLEGNLVLDPEGCLRVESGGGSGPLIIWHHDFTLRVEGQQIEVLNGDGQVVGRVGEAIRMGGGETPQAGIPGMPLEACPGPYWVLGDIQPVEPGPSSGLPRWPKSRSSTGLPSDAAWISITSTAWIGPG